MWKDIAGYEGLYKVSDEGLVMSFKKQPKILKQWKRSKYNLVDLWKDGNRDVRSVHVLVYETFNGPLPDGYIVHHIDENKFNNRLDNLQAVTMLEHNRHHCCGRPAWNKGISTPKETTTKVWNARYAKLIPRYLQICEAHDNGESVRSIAERFKTCTRQVYTILSRREIYVERLGKSNLKEQQNK